MTNKVSRSKRVSWLVSRYLLGSIMPYFLFAWLLLTVILFVQQASRYSDIFFDANVPGELVWQLAVALLPNVIAFTCPMAMLVGTVIGLTKMQGDSELVAIRASGVANWQIAVPIAVVGVLLSVFAFLVNSRGVPLAASLVRHVALQTAIKKLESPVEPGTFNRDVTGYTLYVDKGDVDTGRWQNIFIYSEDASKGTVRVITSNSGRIDTSDDESELALDNASVVTMPMVPGQGKYAVENVGDLRLSIRTSRSELLKRVSSIRLTPEELGLAELSDYAASADRTDKERRDAQLLQQRRILLSITPFIFCMLGTVIVLRLNRGGRGFGIALALVVLVIYYLLAFLGEQLGRTGQIPVLAAGLFPLAGSAAAFLWFSLSQRMAWLNAIPQAFASWTSAYRGRAKRVRIRDVFVDVTTGIRDFDIARGLVGNFLLTLAFVAAIFVIFTGFEMWKYAGVIEGGVWLLIRYLVYLLPFIYLQVAPSAAMIAILATYVVKSRQNEIVTWTSAGQSVYRLLLPCFLLTVLLGAFNWIFQENVVPRSNQMQDMVRETIRDPNQARGDSGTKWLASKDRRYALSIASDNEKAAAINSASDNEKQSRGANGIPLSHVSVYDLGTEGKLRSVYRGDQAQWQDGRISFIGLTEKDDVVDGRVITSNQYGGEVELSSDPRAVTGEKPTHVDTAGLRKQIDDTRSGSRYRMLAISIQRRYSTLLLPLIIALFTAPFSLSLSRYGKAATVGYAVGLWLMFTGISSVCEQLGLSGQLSPALAIWSPLAIFGLFGVFLLSRVKT